MEKALQDRPEVTFTLDEPAAKSHWPQGWITTALLLEPSGRAPKQYGAGVYRFGAALTLSVILPRRGWTLAKRTKTYAYLAPPTAASKPPFQISIAVPDEAECIAIARRSFETGQSWMGQLGEWPAWYLHERSASAQRISRDPATGEVITRSLGGSAPESSLTIGEWGVWEVRVTNRSGEFQVRFRSGQIVSSDGPTYGATPRMYEGEPRSVELTAYERNPLARKRCIEHFGPTCQACGFDYEQTYGAIGAGLIHVHHVTPLASIGQRYEIDPIRDLIPLCASCHHVVHSRNPAYGISEVRAAIAGRMTATFRTSSN